MRGERRGDPDEAMLLHCVYGGVLGSCACPSGAH